MLGPEVSNPGMSICERAGLSRKELVSSGTIIAEGAVMSGAEYGKIIL
jgi:hypothetical protein